MTPGRAHRHIAGAVCGLLSGLLLAVLWVTPAAAHAVLVSTTPDNGAVLDAAPSAVTLEFTEPVRPVPDQVRVIAPDGGRADAGEPTASGERLRIPLGDGLGDGTYLVSFRVVSGDGHPVGGGFSFSIGEPSAAPAAPAASDRGDDPVVATLLSVLRYAGYAGLALLVGGAGALALAWPRRLSRGPPVRLAGMGLAVVLASATGELWLRAPYLTGTGVTAVGAGDVLSVLDSRYGYAHLARVGLLLLAVPLLNRLAAGRDGTWGRVTLGVLVLGALVTWPLSGHPAGSPMPWLSVPLDVAHLGAVSVWLGGLAVLAGLLLRRATRQELGTVLPMWSRWAFGAVAVLVTAGVLQAVVEVAGFAALVQTRYGLLVLAKAGLLVGILVAAVFARHLVRRGGAVADPGGPGRLRRLVLVEVTLAAVVLAVTAVLVHTTPARTELAARAGEAAPSGNTATLTSELYTLHVELDPARVGPNDVHLIATTPAGGRLRVAEWKATAALPERDVAPIEIPLTELTSDHAIGDVTLPSPGRWVFRFTLRTSEIDQATVRVALPVN